MTEANEEPCAAIVVECDLPDAPEKVWRALTERELLAAWLMPNDFRPELGAEFSFQPPAELESQAIACKVLALEPPRLLRFSWQERGAQGPGALSFELTPTPAGGTHLVLIHSAELRSDRRETCAHEALGHQPEDLLGRTRSEALSERPVDTAARRVGAQEAAAHVGRLLYLPTSRVRAGSKPPISSAGSTIQVRHLAPERFRCAA